MDRLLVLVRHGQSEWNLKNLFTGWKDPALTEQGIREGVRQVLLPLWNTFYFFTLYANAAGFIGGFFCSFLLNGRYTFDLSGELGRPFLRYCLLALFSLALSSLLLHAFVQALSMTPEAAKIGVSLLTVCWNFLLYRHFVFREAAA